MVLVLAGLADAGVRDGPHVVFGRVVDFEEPLCEHVNRKGSGVRATNQVRTLVLASFLPPERAMRQLRFIALSMRYKPGPFQSDMVRLLVGVEKKAVVDVGLGSIGDDVGSRKSWGSGRGVLMEVQTC